MRDETIKQALGGNIRFHEDLPKMNKEELLGANMVICDARVIDDWDGQWGTSQFALLLVELEDGRRVTTLMGGKAVVRQVGKLLKRNKLPGRVACFLNQVEGESGHLYYVLDSTDPRENEVKSELAAASAQ